MAKNEKGNWPPYNARAIEQNIRLVMKTGDIRKLNGKTYHVIYQHMSFIAHYSLAGFQDEYQDVEEFRRKLQTSEMSRDYNYTTLQAVREETDSNFNTWYGPAYQKSKVAAMKAIVKAARTRWCKECQKEVETQFGEPLPEGLCDECQAKKVAAQPVCPKCGAKINRLRLYEEAEVLFNLSVDKDGQLVYDQDDILYGDGKQSIECPQCHEELFDDELKAQAFLNGAQQLVLLKEGG